MFWVRRNEMSVTSTITLDRTDAENRYADLIVQCGNPHYFIFKHIMAWDDETLAEELEKMHDLAAGGEGFENYRIVEEE